MKIVFSLFVLLNSIFANEIDFVLQKIEDEEGDFKVIMPTLDGKPMPAALSVKDTVTAEDFLPVIFKDTIGRQSEIQFISLIDIENIDSYQAQIEGKGSEMEDHQVIGKIDEDSIVLSIETARHNLHKIKTFDAKLEGGYLKQVKREYAKRGDKLKPLKLSDYDRIVSMIPDTSGQDYKQFKGASPPPEDKIIDAWEAEDEEEDHIEVVYVLLDRSDNANLKTDKQVAAGKGDNDIDILISAFTRAGIELVDKVAIQVVMNDSEFTEIQIEETEELKDYKFAPETDNFVRVIFTDSANQMCSKPVACLLLHKLDKTNTLDSIDESQTQLSRENAVELNAFGSFDENQPEPIMLNRYSKVEEVKVIASEDLSMEMESAQKIIELGVDYSVLMISVSNPFQEMLRKHLLLL